MREQASRALDANYPGVSPQLLARVRQQWSARGLDLDGLWRGSVRDAAGFSAIGRPGLTSDSRPVDILFLFDQSAIWIDCLARAAAGRVLRVDAGAETISHDQWRALASIFERMREGLAATRLLSLGGLSRPAMQVARSLSEDVDTALMILLRPKLATRFVRCQSPGEAVDFWRRHIAGGRAFRSVGEHLYRLGLDFSETSDYAHWRKEVLVYLGTVVHTSFLGGSRDADPDSGALAGAEECLSFATIRVQEFCAHALLLNGAFRAALAADPRNDAGRFADEGFDVILDQMRWMIATPAA